MFDEQTETDLQDSQKAQIMIFLKYETMKMIEIWVITTFLCISGFAVCANVSNIQ